MKCPNCDRSWLWDWEEDTYRLEDGTMCDSNDLSNDPKDVTYNCFCGQLLGVQAEEGGLTQEPPEWEGVDWERWPNCY